MFLKINQRLNPTLKKNDMSYYGIKVTNKSGKKGYVIDSPDGINIITNGLTDITQFKTWKEAYWFIREKKLEKNGVKAFILSNTDLIEEENNGQIKPLNKIMYYLEDESGRKLFYSTSEEDYYFENRDTGFVVFESEEQINEFTKRKGFLFKTQIKKIFPN